MNKKIIILLVVLIIVLAAIIGLYFYYITKPSVITNKNLNAPVEEKKAVSPLSDMEEKFFCYGKEKGAVGEFFIGQHLYQDFLRMIYEGVGYNNVNECKQNENILIAANISDTADVVATCQNNSNGIQYLKTGDKKFVDNIDRKDVADTYLAVKAKDKSLCPPDFPACPSFFNLFCTTDEELKSNQDLLLRFVALNSMLDPNFAPSGGKNDLDKLSQQVNKNRVYICDIYNKENQVIFNRGDSCDQFNKDKNLLERVSFLRCSNFIQAETNYCLDELKRLTSPTIKAYIMNNCENP